MSEPVDEGHSPDVLEGVRARGSARKRETVTRENVFMGTDRMRPEEKERALGWAVEAVNRFDSEMDVARFLKDNFDSAFGDKWHCVVGRHFASHVSYENEHYIYFKIGREVILLFKSGGVGKPAGHT
ncbi:dynein light chain [Gregarina niphandrodes]|uniref:Dynein light chain n=1 Tax=Gregarina niphandrodes TaxID=110365 RepID=A0A023B302_GRENI|nr:dynein light chain [Gregarina niphandrodes]EZG55287.1 dynein light chain [Gregarina niphandrodes]|eukprot:XP_011131666.1 dynein light chain [Gregarina niphandrodes]